MKKSIRLTQIEGGEDLPPGVKEFVALALEAGANELYVEFDERLDPLEKWFLRHDTTRGKVISVLKWLLPSAVVIVETLRILKI